MSRAKAKTKNKERQLYGVVVSGSSVVAWVTAGELEDTLAQMAMDYTPGTEVFVTKIIATTEIKHIRTVKDLDKILANL